MLDLMQAMARLGDGYTRCATHVSEFQVECRFPSSDPSCPPSLPRSPFLLASLRHRSGSRQDKERQCVYDIMREYIGLMKAFAVCFVIASFVVSHFVRVALC